jgi:hypothetical protein
MFSLCLEFPRGRAAGDRSVTAFAPNNISSRTEVRFSMNW